MNCVSVPAAPKRLDQLVMHDGNTSGCSAEADPSAALRSWCKLGWKAAAAYLSTCGIPAFENEISVTDFS